METAVKRPPFQPSNEADPHGLDLALKQGKAYGETLNYMVQDIAHGGSLRAGEYLVAYAVEEAEGLYVYRDGALDWQPPQNENAHIEIAVRDGVDGRFVPELRVQLTVLDSQGKSVGTHIQPFLWHPWLYHYGRNWVIPQDGNYTLVVRIDPPRFMRHDKTNGMRYAEPVEVTFKDVRIKTGRKQS